MKTVDFSMDYSSMESLASDVVNMQTDFEEMCKSLESLVESLEGQWQGSAQKEFAIAYSKLKPQLDSISDVLKHFSERLNKLSPKIQNADQYSGRF